MITGVPVYSIPIRLITYLSLYLCICVCVSLHAHPHTHMYIAIQENIFEIEKCKTNNIQVTLHSSGAAPILNDCYP